MLGGIQFTIHQKEFHMAKPNYAFAKRQRDLAKKQAKEEKKQRKASPVDGQPQEEAEATQPQTSTDADTAN
jgi:hypothetical protein